MSRYVSVALELSEREHLLTALRGLGLEAEVAAEGEAIMLEGSLECAGEPVEVRLAPGTLGAVEDFGFVRQQGRYVLVCGEPDRNHLERDLLPRLRAQATLEHTRAVAQRLGDRVEESIEPDGTRRIVIKRGN